MAIEVGKIRNVGVVGHGGVGKTSLVEALLFTAGAVTRLGRVEDGSTTSDFDPDEIKRQISLNTSVAYCDWKGHRINLVDTPGYGDFIADARAGLRVVEAAIVVVDAVAGVQVQTEKVWKFATEYGLPRAVVINCLDRERSDFFRTLDSVGRRLKGAWCRSRSPSGGERLPGVRRPRQDEGRHLRRRQAAGREVPADGGRPGQGVPREAGGSRSRDRRRLLNKYLEEGSLGEAEMLKALRAGIAGGKLVPVLAAAAPRRSGPPRCSIFWSSPSLAPRSRRGERHRPQDQAGGQPAPDPRLR